MSVAGIFVSGGGVIKMDGCEVTTTSKGVSTKVKFSSPTQVTEFEKGLLYFSKEDASKEDFPNTGDTKQLTDKSTEKKQIEVFPGSHVEVPSNFVPGYIYKDDTLHLGQAYNINGVDVIVPTGQSVHGSVLGSPGNFHVRYQNTVFFCAYNIGFFIESPRCIYIDGRRFDLHDTLNLYENDLNNYEYFTRSNVVSAGIVFIAITGFYIFTRLLTR